ncbi:FG-GAP-like repeat-containing protein [Kribbella sp. NPDC058245]|uniref:FG-GAP-like repeat-containing protein n=1 Tax=Kribbella sp. NPDC058245 TaxID=3346399 RepID=UPI0036E8D935
MTVPAVVVLLLAGLLPISAAYAAEAPYPHACEPDSPLWPGCIPTETAMSNATRTGPNKAFFWTGGIETQAGAIASVRGGSTLEMLLDNAHLVMPRLKPRTQPAVDAWDYASRSMARSASGSSYVVKGDTVRPGNVWERVEFPALKANPLINCVYEITARTADQQLLWFRPGKERECLDKEQLEEAILACKNWDSADWPHDIKSEDPTSTVFLNGQPWNERMFLYGGAPDPGGQTRTHVFSTAPTTARSVAEARTFVQNNGRMYVRFAANNRDVESIEVRTADGRVVLENAGIDTLDCESAKLGKWGLRKRNIRALPAGDSITYGIGSSTESSYRADLMDQLHGNTVDYVGSQRSGQLSDPDNEGHPGAVISEISGSALGTLSSSRPNVVLLHAGTNDLNKPVDPDNAPGRLAKLIDDLTAAAPQTPVLVSTLVPASNPTTQARIEDYNSHVTEIVNDRREAGKRVVEVDMGALTTADLRDGLHPNDAGYEKMADAFYAGLTIANSRGWIVDATGGGGGGGSVCQTDPVWHPWGQVASGGFTNTSSPQSPYVDFADLNGDNRDDYLVVNKTSGAVTAYINGGLGPKDGNAVWHPWGEVASGVLTSGNYLDFADLNGDGRDDYLVVNNTSGAVTAYINGGLGPKNQNAVWHPWGKVASGVKTASNHVAFADLNGDGRDDYLLVNNTSGAVTAYINGGLGPKNQNAIWDAWGQVASGAGEFVVFADLNGDDRDDYLLVTPQSGAVTSYVNGGLGPRNQNAIWHPRGQVASGGGASGAMVRLVDLNGDHRDDYAMLNNVGAVNLYVNGC